MPRFTLKSFDCEADWLASRRNYITASDAPVLCGKVSGKNAMTVWADKVEPSPTPSKREVFFRIGHAVEQLNADLYEEATGRELHDYGAYTLCVSKEIPYIAATLDRMVTDKDLGKGCHELKWRGTHNTKSLEEYWCQLQHQMLATGFQWGSISILDASGSWDWHGFDRDEQFLDAYKRLARDFWMHVLCKTCPGPLDGSDATQDALKRVFPTDNGEEIILPFEARAWDEEYQILHAQEGDLKRDLDHVQKAKKSIAQNIMAVMGEATVGVLDNCRYTLNTTEVGPQTKAGYSFRVLRRKANKDD